MWDRTSAYIGVAASPYQSISDLTQHMNEWNEALDHNTGSSMPYSLRIVCGFFYVPRGSLRNDDGYGNDNAKKQ